MKAALLALVLGAAVAALPLAAQVHATPPAPPQPPAGERIIVKGPRVLVGANWADSISEKELKSLSDSITLIAEEMAKARLSGVAAGRIGYLQGRLGSLEGRLGSLHGQLGDLQGQLGQLDESRGDLPVRVVKIRHTLGSKELMQLLKRVSQDPHGATLPPQDSIAQSNYAVAPGAKVGRVATIGQLDVFGDVAGNAIALNGDVIVHKGGHVTGDALSVGGTVRLDGGVVDGEMRSLDRAVAPTEAVAATSSGFLSILDELQMAMGWLVVMVLCGFAAMVFAEERLRIVVSTIESRFGRALFAGILAEVSFIPLLVLAIVLLVVTIVGIVLLPVAIPGIIVVAALLGILGFLAVSRVAGQALTRRAATVSVRGAELRSMLAGLFFFFGLWLVAALLSWVPVLGSLLHALAFVVTWAAATVGLGAAVITRGGGRPARSPIVANDGTPELGWETPTPISGIAAARRQATNTPEA